jgi:hypothetical protein
MKRFRGCHDVPHVEDQPAREAPAMKLTPRKCPMCGLTCPPGVLTCDEKNLWDSVLGRVSRAIPIPPDAAPPHLAKPPVGCSGPPLACRFTLRRRDLAASPFGAGR